MNLVKVVFNKRPHIMRALDRFQTYDMFFTH